MRLSALIQNKSLYLTTPIFYVNSVPHIGHLYTALLTDTYARWKQIKNKNELIVFATGTDEHGIKIQKQANLNKKNCLEFCDGISGKFRNLFDDFDIKYTDFVRTTEDRHKIAVVEFWNTLVKNGFIYKSTYNGWYSVNDENFLTDDQIDVITDKTGNTTRVSKESGHTVEIVSEVNYIFRLSEFRDKLHSYLRSNVIIPNKYQEFLNTQIDDLKDLSVSREASRISWGIPVPNDPSQIIYVWLDALVNYLTVAGYPNNNDKFSKLWPADVHSVGKDILKFHAIYWPAFLLAANLPLPKRILCHGHWLVDNKKMSKSIGNVIDPFELKDKCTVDGLRYFLLREGVPASDNNINLDKILNILNTELSNTFGNLYQRCISDRINPNKTYPSYSEIQMSLSQSDNDFLNRLNILRDECEASNEQFNFYESIQKIMAILRDTNTLVNDVKPWILAKSKNDTDTMELHKLFFIVFEVLRICSILLQPITPNLSGKLLDYLNVNVNERTFENAQVNKSFGCGKKLNTQANTVLFKKI